MKWIYTTQNWFVCVDDEDYEELVKISWKNTGSGYAVKKYGPNIYMHTYILKHSSKDTVVDHINRARWDNRKQNLRIITIKENAKNIGIPINPPFPTEEEKEQAFLRKYPNKDLRNKKPKRKGNFKPVNGRPVKNITTGTSFKNITQAANFYKLSSRTLNNHLKDRKKHCGGYKWKYLDE